MASWSQPAAQNPRGRPRGFGGLSLLNLARGFRAAVGKAPHAYLLGRCVAHGQAMLRAGEQTLTDIALACGVADPSHFITAFRRATGSTPRRWREGPR